MSLPLCPRSVRSNVERGVATCIPPSFHYCIKIWSWPIIEKKRWWIPWYQIEASKNISPTNQSWLGSIHPSSHRSDESRCVAYWFYVAVHTVQFNTNNEKKLKYKLMIQNIILALNSLHTHKIWHMCACSCACATCSVLGLSGLNLYINFVVIFIPYL